MKKRSAPPPPNATHRHYIHTACGNSSVMDQKLIDAFVLDPACREVLHCAFCQSYFRLADFAWPNGKVVGS